MNFVIETITPEKAEAYLKTNTKNRPISKTFIISYADTMRKGGWMLNGVPIVFDTDGQLIDGQHRLLAVKEAGVPVQFAVVRGVRGDAFTTFDCGRHRALGQLIAMQGVKNYNLVAAVVSANRTLVEHGRLYNNSSSVSKARRPSNNEEYERYRLDTDGYIKVANTIRNMSDKCRILSASWAGGMYYYLTHTGGYEEEMVYNFFDNLYALESSSIPVVNVLRKILTTAKLKGRNIQPELLWAYLAKTWNHYVKGASPTRIVYRIGVDEIPKLILNN